MFDFTHDVPFGTFRQKAGFPKNAFIATLFANNFYTHIGIGSAQYWSQKGDF